MGKALLLSAISVFSNTSLAVAAARQALDCAAEDEDDNSGLIRDGPVSARWAYGAVTS
jgi:hypothetical protein